MADQSYFSKYPKKQLVVITRELIDKGFDSRHLYGRDNYEDNYNILVNLGKYFDFGVSDEDVQFFAKLIEINDTLLSKIFGGDKSLIDSLEIPIARDYKILYDSFGVSSFIEHLYYIHSSYDEDWVTDSIKTLYEDGNWDIHSGSEYEPTEYDSYEINDWSITGVEEVNDIKKESLLSKLVIENTSDVVNSLDKETLLKLKTIIDSKLRLL